MTNHFRDGLAKKLLEQVTTFPDGNPDLWLVQNEAVTGMAEALRDNPDSRDFLIHMFTATGKTRLFIYLAQLMEAGHTPPRIIIAEPTRDLITKVYEEIQTWAPDWIKNGHVGIVDTDTKEYERAITITTHVGLVQGTYKERFIPAETELLILDEAHEFMSQRRRDVRLQYRKSSLVLELTSTPDYSSDKSIKDFAVTAYALDAESAVVKKAVVPFRTNLIFSTTSLDTVDLAPNGEDFDDASLAHVTNNRARNLTALRTYLHYVDPETGIPAFGQQAAVNCSGIQHAKDFATLANAVLGPYMPEGVVACVAIYGKGISKAERADILRRFDEDKIVMLANIDLLGRGWRDSSNRASLTFNLRPMKSAFKVGQRGGRLLGLCKVNPEKIATIFDIVDKVSDPEKLPLLFGEYLKGVRFGTIPKTWKRSAGTSSRSRFSVSDAEFATLPEMLTSVEDIEAFMRSRQEARAIAERNGVINDTVLPEIRARMESQAIPSLYRLWEEVEPLIPPPEYRHTDDFRPTFERFARIVTGITSPYHTRQGHVTLEADALALYFKTYAHKLFPNAKLIEPTTQYDDDNDDDATSKYNPVVQERFQAAMQRAGYASLTELGQDCRTAAPEGGPAKGKAIGMSFISGLARGATTPFAQGGWSHNALEIAMMLGELPEYLYDCETPEKASRWLETSKDCRPTYSSRIWGDAMPEWTQYEETVRKNLSDADEADFWEEPLNWDSEDPQAHPLHANDLLKDPCQVAEQNIFTQTMRELATSLPRKQQKILKMRFGIECPDKYTLKEVGDMLDFTGESIRRVEVQALKDLLELSVITGTRGHLDEPENQRTTSLERRNAIHKWCRMVGEAIEETCDSWVYLQEAEDAEISEQWNAAAQRVFQLSGTANAVDMNDVIHEAFKVFKIDPQKDKTHQLVRLFDARPYKYARLAYE